MHHLSADGALSRPPDRISAGKIHPADDWTMTHCLGDRD